MQVRSFSSNVLGASLLAAGCGGNVVVDVAGNGGAPTTSSTGAGAGTSTTSVSATASTTSNGTGGSSGTGGEPCIGVFNLMVDGAPPGGKLLTSLCDTTWNPLMATTPTGYLIEGGPPPGGVDLHVDACASATSDSEGVHVEVPGAESQGAFKGDVTYTDGQGGTWKISEAPIIVVEVGPVGQYIQGTFDTKVTNGSSSTHALNVKFSVCHAPDEEAP